MNLLRACALGALAVLGTAAASRAGTVINSGLPNSNPINFYGEVNTASYGQTFTVGADNVLTDFTFYLNHFAGGASNFNFYVMAWNGTTASGPVLFSSGPYSLTSSALLPLTFATGNLALTTGAQYIAFINTSNNFDGTSDEGQMGTPGGDTYAGGKFVYLNNGNNFSRVTIDAWTQNYPGSGGLNSDTSFIANFSSGGDASAAPLPSTAGAGLLLVGGVGMFRARRRLGVC